MSKPGQTTQPVFAGTSRSFYHSNHPFLTRTRSAVRHITLSGLAAYSGIRRDFSRWLGAPRVEFLYLHHVFDDEESNFRRLIERLISRNQTFISYSEAIERILEGRVDSAYVSISFDDGLKNCLTAGRILSTYGIEGCFFVCPSIVGVTDPEIVADFCKTRLLCPPAEFLDWCDLQSLLDCGHEIGGHTMGHVNLATVTTQQIQDEVDGCYDVLSNRLGGVRHFSWPFGTFRDITSEAMSAVFDAGFETCASAVRGCHVRAPHTTRDLCIRRNHVQANWPIHHVLYFMMRNAKHAASQSYDRTLSERAFATTGSA